MMKIRHMQGNCMHVLWGFFHRMLPGDMTRSKSVSHSCQFCMEKNGVRCFQSLFFFFLYVIVSTVKVALLFLIIMRTHCEDSESCMVYKYKEVQITWNPKAPTLTLQHPTTSC